jgi:hypothetical protein
VPVLPVRYQDSNYRPLNTFQLVTRKRRPYAYEKERRIVSIKAPISPNSIGGLLGIGHPSGFELRWDPEVHVDRVLIHPGADSAATLAVTAVVEALAPRLLRRVAPSVMAELPPT